MTQPDTSIRKDMANRIIEGLLIFQKYQDTEFFIGAEHDIIYAYATSKPIPIDEVKALIKLGWFQPEVEFTADDGDEMSPNDYDHDEGWGIYP